MARDLGGGARRPLPQQRDDALPCRRHARRLAGPQPVRGANGRGLQSAGDAHRHAQNGAPGWSACSRPSSRPGGGAARSSAGSSSTAVTGLRRAGSTSPSPSPQTTPTRSTLPSGTRTKAPSDAGREFGGHGVVVGALQRQRHEHGDGRRRARALPAPSSAVGRLAHGTPPAAARWNRRSGRAKRPPQFVAGPKPSRVADAAVMLSSCITRAPASSPMTAGAG